jgi:hypothetical protein
MPLAQISILQNIGPLGPVKAGILDCWAMRIAKGLRIGLNWLPCSPQGY